MSKVQWSKAPVPEAMAALCQAGYPAALAELLARRGVGDAAGAKSFLQPDLAQLHDPGLLSGLPAAVERLLRAREAGETVVVVGDYDVDGVTGTALLTAVLRACRFAVQPILPHRLRDGYGFQPCHVEQACACGGRVLVTVDCGCSAIAAAQAAIAAGLDVIVTDHHLPGEPLPAGVVQINPQQEACSYPFPHLSGAGLALKLALAVAAACRREVDLRALLRIACLGTIADLVPLQGENRVIAALGLSELATTRSAGLKALLRVAGLQPPFSAADVGFRIGPRLNAPGRLESAEAALELLLSRDPRRSSQLALDLDRCNRERQVHEQRVADEAREVFLKLPELPPILVAWSPAWHRGVVGIAAGRLAKELHRPVVLLAVEGDTATGSGRSLRDIHLYQFLSEWKGELLRFGGHAQAIGLTARCAELPRLQEQWQERAAVFQDKVAVRTYEYELELAPKAVTEAFHAELRQLEPHGQGNPEPLVKLAGPLRLVRAPRIFGRGHLAAEAASPDGGTIRLLGWGWENRASQLLGDFEVLGFLETDRRHGGIVLRLVDSRPCGPAARDREKG